MVDEVDRIVAGDNKPHDNGTVHIGAFDLSIIRELDRCEIKRKIILAQEIDNTELVQAYCAELLRRDPTDGEAYLFLLQADLGVQSIEMLAECGQSFSDNKNYKYAIKFCESNISAELERFAAKVDSRLARNKLCEKYNNAKLRMNYAKTEIDFLNAAAIFEELEDYSDSGTLKDECLVLAARQHKKALFKKAVKIGIPIILVLSIVIILTAL